MHASVCETFDLRRVFFAPVSSVYFEGTGDCFPGPGSRVRVTVTVTDTVTVTVATAGAGGPGGSGLRSGFDPPDLDRPGRLQNQQGLCEASTETGHPNWGPRDPG